jgi:hypothetical protein
MIATTGSFTLKMNRTKDEAAFANLAFRRNGGQRTILLLLSGYDYAWLVM